MVTRKPLPENASIDPKAAPQLRVQDMRQELRSATESEDNPDRMWQDGPERRNNHEDHAPGGLTPEEVPESLRPGSGLSRPSSRPSPSYSSLEEEGNVWREEPKTLIPSGLIEQGGGGGGGLSPVPSVLRPGGSGLKAETNPFLKRKISGGSPASSQEAISVPPLPLDSPPIPPTASFSNLSVNEPSNNPWQPALDEKKLPVYSSPAVPTVADQDAGKEVWGSSVPSRQPSTGPPSGSPALLSLASEEEPAPWAEEEPPKVAFPPALVKPAGEEAFEEDRHAWDDLGNVDKGKAPARPPLPKAGSAGPVDDWNLIEHDGNMGPPSKQSTWENFEDAEEEITTVQPLPQEAQDTPPALPPRKSAERQAPQRPSLPANDKSETYQIKNINWYDVNAAENPRTSPILVQNANGPCPLVALVNALTLTTPADVNNTALVETLRSREQVSLGLLLDAVFDELMSPRRYNDDSLPDVTELYAFLKGLHTGMNVNPRFIPSPEIIRMFKRTSLTHLHPTERGDMIPGTFETTKEMTLYATFSIPLIHGWLPPRDEVVYEALGRRAVSYEDAQNLLFREEELEEKLSGASPHQEGLSEEEQELYQDILTIKSFLSISATQLTPWGLEVITKAMRPGSVAILFRNDHFATLYRHPQTLELLTLVTDAGYASHDEIVWESLVDVNGEKAEFFSGDFRLVGGAHHQQPGPTNGSGSFPGSASNEGEWPSLGATGRDGGGGWTTVASRRGGRNQNQSQNRSSDDPPLSPTHEQEDRDLALALQLQEEEDERHRAELERRRRESILSEQYIEQQAQQAPGALDGAGPGNRGGGGSAPSLTPGRRSSSVSVPVTTTGGSRGGGAGRGRGGRWGPQSRRHSQTVRSLIPGAGEGGGGVVTGVVRRGTSGDDVPPPSYEQAAKQTPYLPPAGHPSHPASSPDQRTAGPSAPAPAGGGGRGGVANVRNSAVPMNNIPVAPGPGRMRQQAVPAGAVAGAPGSAGRDRDCVVM